MRTAIYLGLAGLSAAIATVLASAAVVAWVVMDDADQQRRHR